MINRFPKLFLLLTSVLFIGTVATLKNIGALTADRVSQNIWILLGCELGALLCICLCALREAYLLRRKVREFRDRTYYKRNQHKTQVIHAPLAKKLFPPRHKKSMPLRGRGMPVSLIRPRWCRSSRP